MPKVAYPQGPSDEPRVGSLVGAQPESEQSPQSIISEGLNEIFKNRFSDTMGGGSESKINFLKAMQKEFESPEKDLTALREMAYKIIRTLSKHTVGGLNFFGASVDLTRTRNVAGAKLSYPDTYQKVCDIFEAEEMKKALCISQEGLYESLLCDDKLDNPLYDEVGDELPLHKVESEKFFVCQ